MHAKSLRRLPFTLNISLTAAVCLMGLAMYAKMREKE